MTVFSPALVTALFKAGALFLAGAEQAVAPAPAPAPVIAEPAPQEPAGVRAPPREVAPMVKVELEPAPAPAATPVPTPETQATAEPDPAPSFPVLPDETILAGVKAALEAVQSSRGRFEQIAPDGSYSAGSFAIRRPGRVRFDYDDPVKLLIVADGATIAIEDGELDTVERVPLASTPLNVILGGKADFEASARVTEVRQGNGYAAITVVDPRGEYEGELTLIFEMDGWTLLRWQTVDALGGITSVILSDVETNIALDPRLFRLEEDRDSRERDERR